MSYKDIILPPPHHLAKVVVGRNVKVENLSGVWPENVKTVLPLNLETIDGFVLLPLIRKLNKSWNNSNN